jgi:dCMP deaminase
MKQKFIDYFMDVAERTSQLSHAIRLKVGAIIVKDGRIISIGYNGMPAGWDNNCEEVVDVDISDIRYNYNHFTKELKTRPEVLHAETNAISKLARSTEAGDNSTLFCTHAPCIDCAKLIYQSGISSVYYRDTYRDDSGLKFLEKSGVNVTQYTIQN